MTDDWKTKIINKKERYFFDIPIFRCEINKWSEEQESKKEKLAIKIAGDKYKVSEREIGFAEKWLIPEWSAYYYSELVGVIRLYSINKQIRAELWFVKQKISKNLKHKKWYLAESKLFETQINNKEKNANIYKWILNRLIKENEEHSLLKKRYIDLEAFVNIGENIDFIKLTSFK